MSRTTRRSILVAAVAAYAVLPLQAAQACLHADLHANILFEESPDQIPYGLAARHVHLTNQVPEFEIWRDRREFSFEGKDVDMRHFSFIGLGAPINPWTHWLTNMLPEWLVGKPDYEPIFAPTSSCTVRFEPFEKEIDLTVMLVGAPIAMTSGEKAFAAASHQHSGDRWVTHRGYFASQSD